RAGPAIWPGASWSSTRKTAVRAGNPERGRPARGASVTSSGGNVQPGIILVEHPVGAIGRTHQWPGNNFQKAARQAPLPVFGEIRWRHIARHGQVIDSRAHVLAKSHDIHVGGLEV